MSKSYLEVLVKVLEERKRLLADWRRIVREAARAVRELYPKAKVYVTGSIVEGRAIASSDIDLVVVLPCKPSAREAARIIAYVWEKLSLPLNHPLEVHVVSESDLEKYKRKGKLLEITA